MLYRLTIYPFAYEMQTFGVGLCCISSAQIATVECHHHFVTFIPRYSHVGFYKTLQRRSVFLLAPVLIFSLVSPPRFFEYENGHCKEGGAGGLRWDLFNCDTCIVSVTVSIEMCSSLSTLSRRGTGSCGWRPWMEKSLWVCFSSAEVFFFGFSQTGARKIAPTLFKSPPEIRSKRIILVSKSNMVKWTSAC